MRFIDGFILLILFYSFDNSSEFAVPPDIEMLILYFFPEAVLEHILLEMREEDAVFGPARHTGPPCTSENNVLFVEGTVAARYCSFKNKVDQYLTWGEGGVHHFRSKIWRACR